MARCQKLRQRGSKPKPKLEAIAERFGLSIDGYAPLDVIAGTAVLACWDHTKALEAVEKALSAWEAGQAKAKPERLVTASLDDIDSDLARGAFRHTSFSPEKMGDIYRQDYVNSFNDLHDELIKEVEEVQHEQLRQELERFKANKLKWNIEILHSHSRIASPMITGPAKFPVARMEKANNAHRNKVEKYLAWHERAVKAIKSRLGLLSQGVIFSDDSDALTKLRERIAELEAEQEHMKAVNKEYRRCKGDVDRMKVDDKERILVKAFKERKESWWDNQPYQGFQLRNNNANIRRLKVRLATLSRRQATPSQEIEFDGGTLVDSQDDNRVQIFYDEKPSKDTIKELKRRGFRWAPSVKAWQRHRSPEALSLAKMICDIDD